MRYPRGGPRIALAALLLVVAIVGVGLVVLRPGGSGATAAARPTTWEAITDKIRDGKPSKQVALEAFAYLYGISIPGVHVPFGSKPADDAPLSGTEVVRWVQANWSGMSADQQAAVAPFLGAQPGDAVVTYPLPTARGPVPRSPDPVAVTRPGPAAVPRPGPVGIPRSRVQLLDRAPQRRETITSAVPNDAFQAAFHDEVLADIAHIGPKLGLPAISEGASLWTNVTVAFSNASGGNTLLQTNASVNAAGIYSPCNMVVYSNAWQGEKVTNGKVSDRLHVLVTHEVVHCYQNVIWGSVPVARAEPSWITEGTALWLAADDTKLLETMVPSQWRVGYFGNPEKALTNRTYDSYGYFALLSHLGRDLWSLMVPAWKAAAASSANPSGPFIAQLNGDAEDVRDAWATSYLRQSAWNDPWIAYGFGLPDDLQVWRHPITAGKDPGYLGSLDSRSNTVLSVEDAAGEVVVVQTDGVASAHDESGHGDLAFQSRVFCVSGDCICPPNTVRAGDHVADDHMSLPFVLALNAGEGGSKYRVVGRSLEDECGPRHDEPYPPAPPGGGGSGGGGGGGDGDSTCGTGCGGSNGDPHLRTIDNVDYDFQAAGEFVLLRSVDGSLEIQARQEPYGGSDHVSSNTAVAARVGAHRVAVYDSDRVLRVRVDGQATDASSPVDLGDGGEVARHPRGIEISFPDGTQLWALSVGSWGINIQVRPSPALRATGVGLLGVVLPGGLGVPALRDGTRLPRIKDPAERFKAVHGQLADAWRVTASNSLFDYDAGKSASSYTVPDFPNPANELTPGDLTLEQRQAAAAACAGVNDLGLLEQCLYDVTVTSDPGFGAQYAATDDLDEHGVATLDQPAAGGPSPSPTPTAMPGPPSSDSPAPSTPPAGAVVTGFSRLLGSAIARDGTVYVSLAEPDDRFELDAIDPARGVVLRKVDAQGGGQLVLAAGSLWAAEFAGGSGCSVTRLDPATFAVQATITTQCNFFHTAMAATSDGVSVLDRTLAGSTQEGVRRIDPTSNAVSDPVVVPFFNGFLFGSDSGVVYGDDDQGWFRLPTGATQLVPLGSHSSPVWAAEDGIWNAEDEVAQFFNAAGDPARTITIDGNLVSADAAALYVAQPSRVGGSDELWRYPVDGANPEHLGDAPPPFGSTSLSYFDNDPVLVAGSGVAKLWQVPETGSTEGLVVQWLPINP